ncbi:MAG TPA: hypothetical protein VGA61_02190 [Anaerolineae bacterium]
MEEEMEPTPTQPSVTAVTPEKQFAKLRQVTVGKDEEIENVNQLLDDGWRLISIGYRPDATVFVLGQLEERRRNRAGFGFRREE